MVGVEVRVGGTGVEVCEGVTVLVGAGIAVGAHAIKIKPTNKTPKIDFGFMPAYVWQ